ncbi:MAG: HAMP domain-containing histidine kinase [Clostridium sp.]|nr:HAMP domain-containing histidine kinase [Clostridium sp.]MCM1278862.1 HAMP domain-containing histidine kinase [Robinsoniella sp.]
MIDWLLTFALIIAGYFALRYFFIKHALKEINRELQDIQRDMAQNQILHLPMPERDLEQLIFTINTALDEVRRERQSYERREKEFQQQIENISHDLRTPLTVILGYIRFMKKSMKEGNPLQDQTEALSVIERKAGTMEKLVSQFYSYSRLNAQDYPLNLQEIDVCRLLRESLMDNYQILEKAGLKVESRLPEHPVMVWGEADALERIFSNLFQNAGRYADSFLEIHIKESREKTLITLTNDTDKISKEELPYLFDRFYVQDGARNQDGTGLGLTVARLLAEAMDGALTVEVVDERMKGDEGKEVIICFTLSLKK